VNEPSLLVALPNAVRELLRPGRLPDVSTLVAEWTALLDPPAALADAATRDAERLRDWPVGGRAAVSSTALRHLRDAAKRDDVADVLRSLTPERGGDTIDCRTLPYLLGLAVAAALRAGVGVASSGIRDELRARRTEAPRAAERSEASAAAPTGGAP
jgi:hypothetical protein